MIVERENNEILIRFSAKAKASKIQSILDYLKYEELTSRSKAKKEDLDALLTEAKKGHWGKIKKEIGFEN